VDLIINVINGHQTDPADDFEQFVNKTTEKEKDALRDIIDRIGEEGQLSLSSLIQLTNISRPVYTSLLSKLKEFKIAEVVNAGVKGTKIKFINYGVFDI
jgi:GTP-sensing pleiotropic transcriptional regulator CodY